MTRITKGKNISSNLNKGLQFLHKLDLNQLDQTLFGALMEFYMYAGCIETKKCVEVFGECKARIGSPEQDINPPQQKCIGIRQVKNY